MKSEFEIWSTNRAIYKKFITHNTIGKLNEIPSIFNNNIIWNVGHVIAVQQHLVYRKSGLEMLISNDFFEKYKPGTKPEGSETQESIDQMVALLLSTKDQTIGDFEMGKFKIYDEFNTSKGFHLSSAASAISFNNYHEALHLGNMSSMLNPTCSF
jgi:hypothetical protein